MPKIIIADTSCFILLSNIGELELLHKVYGEITTTLNIAIEYGEVLPDWVTIAKVVDTNMQHFLEQQIDRGESSAISLALETTHTTIILDDSKARRVAKQLSLNVTGTIGVIVKAKLKGIIPSIKPILEKIKDTNFRLTPTIEKEALKEANEEQ